MRIEKKINKVSEDGLCKLSVFSNVSVFFSFFFQTAFYYWYSKIASFISIYFFKILFPLRKGVSFVLFYLVYLLLFSKRWIGT
ncbi:hypothetical protein B0A80_18240 [Flavobacterium tructae]|nr:hypothetical protein B0A80_18240 [Flavobacterium tructae]